MSTKADTLQVFVDQLAGLVGGKDTIDQERDSEAPAEQGKVKQKIKQLLQIAYKPNLGRELA